MVAWERLLRSASQGLRPKRPNTSTLPMRTIIEVLLTRREVPLTGSLRLYVASAA